MRLLPSSTGFTPYFFLYGMELVLPGWQYHRKVPEDNVWRAGVIGIRNTVVMTVILEADEGWKMSKDVYNVGDVVIYCKNNYEKTSDAKSSGNELFKYEPGWSLPCEVVKRKDNSVMVRSLCKPGFTRQCSSSA
eukprot:GHVS01070958.1.p1 GENE.GHVS01070958.1~~GHVS01070958.1.p1  ORF type:complete len:134 (-),score=18.83 GHVS01070958.1:486-887(-)